MPDRWPVVTEPCGTCYGFWGKDGRNRKLSSRSVRTFQVRNQGCRQPRHRTCSDGFAPDEISRDSRACPRQPIAGDWCLVILPSLGRSLWNAACFATKPRYRHP